ncbi:coagulation factor XIII B chain-like isoform X2 [Mixophyes fleayi]|uniref:coagulation factor XIII B chain-like isoform X2 n=1 Tax=Mixophyes fleayi TaxID=3061075 RepID=UPI003F4DC194
MISLKKLILFNLLITLICTETASAQEKQGTCNVPVLEHGHHVPNKVLFKVGEWLQYQCDEGYMTAQRNIVEEVECLSSGWSTVLRCSQTQCSVQSTADLNRLHLVYTNGQKAKFSCDDGLILKGSEISQCYYYGWDPPLPTCEDLGKKSKCPPPPQLLNVDYIKHIGDYFNGDKIQMKCRAGFKRYGPESIFCKNGQWTSPPQCVRIQKCDEPPAIPFATLDPTTKKPEYYSGNIVTYKCNNGFQMNGTHERLCIKGTWSLPPICIEQGQSCSAPPLVTYGEVKSLIQKQYTSGSTVEYQCQHYYIAQGSLNITCKNGHWSDPPVCLEPCTVGHIELSKNNIQLRWKHVDKLYAEHGTIIEFLCLPGFQIQTSSSTFKSKCDRGKLVYPKCVKETTDSVSCQLSEDTIIQNNLVLPRSASKDKAYSNGDKIPTRCKPRYFPASPSLAVECLDGKMIYPKCVQKQPCRLSQEELDENFLELDTSHDYRVFLEDGETINFTCKSGYSIGSDVTGLCIKQIILYPVCHKIE